MFVKSISATCLTSGYAVYRRSLGTSRTELRFVKGWPRDHHHATALFSLDLPRAVVLSEAFRCVSYPVASERQGCGPAIIAALDHRAVGDLVEQGHDEQFDRSHPGLGTDDRPEQQD